MWARMARSPSMRISSVILASAGHTRFAWRAATHPPTRSATRERAMSWAVPAALGAYHGLNPAMGWLFAVALGLQERRAAAVLRALPAIALGHAASVTIVLALVAGASLAVPAHALRIGGALAL